MGMTVYANNRLIIHKGDGLTETCPVPDFCKTPTPGGPVPVPYVNVAMDSDLAGGPKKVKVEGNMPAHMKANLRMSTGDEGGTAGGGVVSNKIKGKMTWVMGSMDVKFEGQGVIRFMDTCLHNGNAPNTGSQPHLGGFQGSYPNVDETTQCVRCGQPISTHETKEIPQSEKSQKKAKKLLDRIEAANPGYLKKKGHMVGVLVVKCPGKKKSSLIAAVSGPGIPGWQAAARGAGMKAASTPVNTAGHVQAPGAPEPGNCAAPRLLAEARARGCTPVAMTEAWCGKSTKTYTHRHAIESCRTCKQNLPQMLCSNEPSQQSSGTPGAAT
ncbi:MAG TPA: PAAR-like domain-containing protein [Gemmataceae bacterium]